MNHSLRQAMTNARLRPEDVAGRLGVDPKTVERWLRGRIPYARHRWAVADLVDLNEVDLWPDVAGTGTAAPPTNELKALYPHRWAVPRVLWTSLFESATDEIGILVYSGLFLAEDSGIARVLSEKSRSGVAVRILIGDPESPHVAERGDDEEIGGDVMAAKIRNALALYRAFHDLDEIQVRLHRTVLYNSIYRADDDMLVNAHAYGIGAAEAPVLHLRRTPDGDLTRLYRDTFERVWSGASPLSR